jgi:hypothetical protein
MFNYYLNEKKCLKKQLESLKPNPISLQKTRDILSRRYKNRINEDLIELDENLKIFPKRSRSPENTSSNLSVMRNPKSQTNDYSLLDPTPSPVQAFSLRLREKSKEIQPPLKFKLIGSDRLKESISNQRQFLDTSTDLRTLNSDFTLPDSFKHSAGKSVYGYFHYKIHPKTFESIALNLHGSTRNASKEEIRKNHRDLNLGLKEKNIDKVSRDELIPMSGRVLEKYGIWKGRHKSQTPSLYC